MKDVMLDLETFGVGPTAAIIQIGAYRFDSGLNGSGVINARHAGMFTVNVSLQSSMLAGCTVDEDTIAFWREPEQATARDSLGAGPIRPLAKALRDFTDWWNVDDDTQFVWGHGASFDIPILTYAFRSMGQATPWNYRDVRDTRTLFQVAKNWGWLPPKREVEMTLHDAGWDASYQAQCVESAALHIKHRGSSGPGET